MYRLTFHVTNTKRKYKVDKKTGKNIGKGEVHNTISIRGFKTLEDARKRYAILREEYTVQKKAGKEMYQIVFE